MRGGLVWSDLWNALNSFLFSWKGLTGPVGCESVLLPCCTSLFNMPALPFRNDGRIHLPGCWTQRKGMRTGRAACVCVRVQCSLVGEILKWPASHSLLEIEFHFSMACGIFCSLLSTRPRRCCFNLDFNPSGWELRIGPCFDRISSAFNSAVNAAPTPNLNKHWSSQQWRTYYST